MIELELRAKYIGFNKIIIFSTHGFSQRYAELPKDVCTTLKLNEEIKILYLNDKLIKVVDRPKYSK